MGVHSYNLAFGDYSSNADFIYQLRDKEHIPPKLKRVSFLRLDDFTRCLSLS